MNCCYRIAIGRQAARSDKYYDSDVYSFTHQTRGLAVIINNEKFLKQSGMAHRPGSDLDATALKKMFKLLGFTVKRYDNLKAKKMVTKLKKGN